VDPQLSGVMKNRSCRQGPDRHAEVWGLWLVSLDNQRVISRPSASTLDDCTYVCFDRPGVSRGYWHVQGWREAGHPRNLSCVRVDDTTSHARVRPSSVSYTFKDRWAATVRRVPPRTAYEFSGIVRFMKVRRPAPMARATLGCRRSWSQIDGADGR